MAPLRHTPAVRGALSLLFLLHWGAVAAYLLPSSEEALADVPEPLATPMRALVVPAAGAVEPVSSRWLGLVAGRQHWGLFAPWPIEWSASLLAVAYYPAGEGGAWSADTVRVRGPRETPYPHWWDHHRFRLVLNMGYESWGSVYRPHHARWLCRTLRGPDGRGPGGVRLVAEWERIQVPWLPPEAKPRYEQFLGGYTCPAGAR